VSSEYLFSPWWKELEGVERVAVLARDFIDEFHEGQIRGRNASASIRAENE
jgi:hypothetical protein